MSVDDGTGFSRDTNCACNNTRSSKKYRISLVVTSFTESSRPYHRRQCRFRPAVCEFDKAQSSHLKRMTAKRAGVAASRLVVERQEWAVPVTGSADMRSNAAPHPMAASSPFS